MRTQFIILLLFIIQFSSWSQGRTIKTVAACSDEVLQKTPGQWFALGSHYQNDHIALSSNEVTEVTKTVDAIHQLIVKMYPQPSGVDAAWHRILGYGTFAGQVGYQTRSDGVQEPVSLKENPVAVFGYISGYFRHFCGNEPNEIWSGYPGETGTWIKIYANNFQQALEPSQQLYGTMTINGYPVRLLQSLRKDIGGFKMLGEKVAGDEIRGYYRYVIIHRKGMLPYIPVTRKQYLTQCIPEVTKFWDEALKGIEQMPQEEGRDEQRKKIKDGKERVLQLYKGEAEKTAKEGLNDAPAVIASYCNPHVDEFNPIFVDETEGWMVVIENQDYMRKDLPKHVPQFFLVSWVCNDWEPQANIGKLMEEEFPFEKLRGMIDK